MDCTKTNERENEQSTNRPTNSTNRPIDQPASQPVNQPASQPPTYLPNSTELSPSWEAASRSATQELLNILWNPKIHYRVHKSPPLVPILSQINPGHTTPSYCCDIHSKYFLTYVLVFLTNRLRSVRKIMAEFLEPLSPNIHKTSQVQVQVTLRLTVSQSVCLGVEPRPGLITRF
jgi:hypothetical protein